MRGINSEQSALAAWQRHMRCWESNRRATSSVSSHELNLVILKLVVDCGGLSARGDVVAGSLFAVLTPMFRSPTSQSHAQQEGQQQKANAVTPNFCRIKRRGRGIRGRGWWVRGRVREILCRGVRGWCNKCFAGTAACVWQGRTGRESCTRANGACRSRAHGMELPRHALQHDDDRGLGSSHHSETM